MGLPFNISFPQFKTFLFCWSLRVGALFVGYSKVVIFPVMGLLYFSSFMYMQRAPISEDHLRYLTSFTPYIIQEVSIFLLEGTFGLVLLYAVYKKSPTYLKIWLVVQFAQLFQGVFTTLVKFVVAFLHRDIFKLLWQLFAIQIFWALDVLLTLLVYSYYRDKYFRDRAGNLVERDFLDTLDDECEAWSDPQEDT